MFGYGAEEPIEDLATPIVGWRAWTVERHRRGWWLASCRLSTSGRSLEEPSRGHVLWQPEGMEARCYCREIRGDGEVVIDREGKRRILRTGGRLDRSCPDCPGAPPEVLGGLGGYGCGLYAMAERSKLAQSPWGTRAHVLGQVELGGRVWPHQGGWRAQYARVLRLDSPSVFGIQDLMQREGLNLSGWNRVWRELRARYEVDD